MTNALIFAVVVLWLVVIALVVAVFALARQVGVLFERVAPMGALVNDTGPKVGEASPGFALADLSGAPVAIGGAKGRSTLVFFLSPTCPVCKKLLPVLLSVRQAERSWLDVVLASDGAPEPHHRFVESAGLAGVPYVLSRDLGIAYRVAKLPFAVLLDGEGIVRGKGLVNNREQLESLFNAKEMGVPSIQGFIGAMTPKDA